MELQRAKSILAKKNAGPCGVLAYCWANAERDMPYKGRDGAHYRLPYYDRTSSQPVMAYYAVLKTNRAGCDVYTLPAGTQDVLFDLDGRSMSAELSKPQKQAEYLRDVIGVEPPSTMDDAIFVASVLESSRVTNVRIEDAFRAAACETEEEHGWNYAEQAQKITAKPVEVVESILTKRSFRHTPPKPTMLRLFVTAVSDFEGVQPRYQDKIESKIPEKLGDNFFECGDFKSLSSLRAAHQKLQCDFQDGVIGGEMIGREIVAVGNGIKVIERIEKKINNMRP